MITLIIVAGLSFQNARSTAIVAHEGVKDLAVTATNNTAGRLGASIRFGNVDELNAQIGDLISASNGRADGAIILSEDGQILAEAGSPDVAALRTLAQSALRDNVDAQNSDDLDFAYRVGFGQENSTVGILAVSWTAEPIMARLRAQTQQKLAVALTLLAVLLTGSTFLLRRILGQPLRRLECSMQAVASGNYTEAISDTARQDEIGRLAKNLDQMRQGLEGAAHAAEAVSLDQREQEEVIATLTQGLRSLAAGDMKVRIDHDFSAKYEQLRSDFNNTASTLHDTLQAVVSNARLIQDEAEDIGRQSGELSQRTETQAATLEETAAALDELTGNVKTAADGAKEVENIVNTTRTEADASGEIVKQTVTAMSEIEDSSRQISTIISVIDDIAFQTNLLALNAGVEAARAGEAGRGFAVVASEVRELAQRSSEAAQQIKDLISGSSEQVARGVKLVDETGSALMAITERVANISTLMSNMASGATEQSRGLAEINLGVGQLDKVTQQNASMVESADVASQTLRQQAAALNEIVTAFEIDEPGAVVQTHRAA
ncbi:methyl-accepting chemotaxis protein [Cognatiyoonia sp. IB215446]|uniref:methyl-accepting chemotaxis protein n=1 Tax=Cognatiyoonia sp. IB215446 TaxID=3097355 RepID=UPI002A13C980|nr:methyl-accepting chemotaxis protein [Cognatiyoonia sp. IB215446]MDX8347916.1 methyl-accepting chemotaxis protein [Cognatiyoonia sp. IB215446]